MLHYKLKHTNKEGTHGDKSRFHIHQYGKLGNKCKDAGEGIFGYRRSRNNDGKLNAAKEIEKASKDKRVCMQPATFILLITMLCPPLGLFLHLGIQSWFHILVCAFLTVKLYYFPGLIYAIMHMLC